MFHHHLIDLAILKQVAARHHCLYCGCCICWDGGLNHFEVGDFVFILVHLLEEGYLLGCLVPQRVIDNENDLRIEFLFSFFVFNELPI